MHAISRFKWLPFLSAMIVSLLLAHAFIYLYILKLEQEQAFLADNVLDTIDDISNNVISVLVDLNMNGGTGCTDENILLMRQVLFKNIAIRDIGYIENGKLFCTTGLGRMDSPAIVGEPTYIGEKGFEIYTNQKLNLFEGKETALIVAYKNYSIVLNMLSLTKINQSPYVWEAVHSLNTKITHLSGHNKVTERLKEKIERLAYIKLPRSYVCSKEFPAYCVAIAVDGSKLIHRDMWLYLIFTILCASAGIAFYALHQNYLISRRLISKRVRKGLKEGNFYWVAQPVLNMKSNKISGCEILARFEDQYGQVSPVDFIPVLRELNLNWKYTELMMKKVLKEFESNSGLPDNFRVGFNIYPRDLMSERSINRLISIIKLLKSRFCVVLEITEDESLDTKVAQANLHRLTQHGLKIAIDDFGTGYSNLNVLKKIDCHILKIDRSFIIDMEDSSIRSSLIPHIVMIAEQLSMDVVAEGVENLRQKKQLAQLGISHAQGYLFGKPMSFSELAELLDKQPVTKDLVSP